MLNWSKQFSILIYLDSNGYKSQYGCYECLMAVGAQAQVSDLDSLQASYEQEKDWLFGHISYDYKNNLIPRLKPARSNTQAIGTFNFFRPDIVCYIAPECSELVVESLTIAPDEVYNSIIQCEEHIAIALPEVHFKKRTRREQYLKAIEQLREHIRNGDCYEINYCNEGYAEHVSLEPLQAFTALNQLSRAPFAAYYRTGDNYMMCASPERYIQKAGDVVCSQPIKGTAGRGTDEATDSAISKQLYNSIKDRAENVMITDLVRNDLARSCVPGSVHVDELYGIYTFPQVHQMISTISGKLSDDCSLTDAIANSFPMGSMTGAPKIKVMELIEQYEDVARGLFSGTVGYITPEGDFDFNVVIRSLFYNSATQVLSYQAGGAITYDSTAEGEWEEMRLKAWALERIFSK